MDKCYNIDNQGGYMKKISLVLVLVMLFFVTGCGSKTKEVKSLNDFYNVTVEKGLIASDNMGSYNADYIKEAMIANKDDLAIEMISYDTSDSATAVQDSNIEAFMTRKSTNAIIKKLKGENYYKYTMVTNGYYLVSSRVDNTLILVNTPVKNKDLVDSVLDSMGY